MFRFVMNFILFGMLFFILHKTMPQAFDTLVLWAGKSYDFLYDVISGLLERLREASVDTPNRDAPG